MSTNHCLDPKLGFQETQGLEVRRVRRLDEGCNTTSSIPFIIPFFLPNMYLATSDKTILQYFVKTGVGVNVNSQKDNSFSERFKYFNVLRHFKTWDGVKITRMGGHRVALVRKGRPCRCRVISVSIRVD